MSTNSTTTTISMKEKNWDYIDPKLITSLADITNYATKLDEEQNHIKQNIKFLTFKDKHLVLRNMQRAKCNAEELITKHKDVLIDYFDSQLEYHSRKRGLNTTCKATFCRPSGLSNENSLMSLPNVTMRTTTTRRRRIMKRRYSEGNLTNSMKYERLIGFLDQSSCNNNVREGREESRREYGYNTDSDDEINSFDGINDIIKNRRMRMSNNNNNNEEVIESSLIDSVTKLKTECSSESFFSNGSYMKMIGNKANIGIINGLNGVNDKGNNCIIINRMEEQTKEIKKLRRLLNFKDKMIYALKRKQSKVNKGYMRYKRNIGMRKKAKFETKDKVDRVEVMKEKLLKAYNTIDRLTKNSVMSMEILKKNDIMIKELLRTKEEITLEFEKSRANKNKVLKNFSCFKSNIEEILESYSNKLSDYNQREEYYMKIKQENLELKSKCKLLIEKLNKYLEFSNS